jgi:hypothetical protein
MVDDAHDVTRPIIGEDPCGRDREAHVGNASCETLEIGQKNNTPA